jgi:hypothetical protein
MSDPKIPASGALTEKATIEVTRHPLPTLHIHEITEQDLAVLNRAHFMRAVHTTLLGMSFSSAVSFIIVLTTMDVKDATLHATFVGVVILSVLVFLYSLIMWGRGEYDANNLQKNFLRKEKLES